MAQNRTTESRARPLGRSESARFTALRRYTLHMFDVALASLSQFAMLLVDSRHLCFSFLETFACSKYIHS